MSAWYKKLTGESYFISVVNDNRLLVYGEPLCKKCLHPVELHSTVLSKLAGGNEIRHCEVGVCPCIIIYKKGKSL
ncbi:MAG: hypothetical protein DA330_08105 [Nitrososphaera sp.]|nr:hypothetical protein [Nitrososphaera sp.]